MKELWGWSAADFLAVWISLGLFLLAGSWGSWPAYPFPREGWNLPWTWVKRLFWLWLIVGLLIVGWGVS